MSLHPDHLADLKKSGLENNTITKLAFSAVVPSRLNKLGAKYKAVSSAYKIPYWNLGGTMNGFERLKLFPPLIDRKGHTTKYYQPPGTDPHLYLPPLLVWRTIANSSEQAIYLTEGEKKAVSLCQKNRPCIGVAGVWNWRVKLDSGERLVCPELDQFVWKGRTVEIIPDSDGWREEKFLNVLGGLYACEITR